MRFYNQPHAFYPGIDLHARSMFTHILDHAGATVFARDLPAGPDAFRDAIAPYRAGLVFDHADHEFNDGTRREKLAEFLQRVFADLRIEPHSAGQRKSAAFNLDQMDEELHVTGRGSAPTPTGATGTNTPARCHPDEPSGHRSPRAPRR